MSNVFGTYTLAEAAAKLEVSQAWIGKVRKLTGIGGSLGTQGKKSAFSSEDLELLKMVETLRIYGLDYKEIKHLYELEIELLRVNNMIKREDSKGTAFLYFYPDKELFLIRKNANKKEVEVFKTKFREYKQIFELISRKLDSYSEKMGYTKKHIETLKNAKV